MRARKKPAPASPALIAALAKRLRAPIDSIRQSPQRNRIVGVAIVAFLLLSAICVLLLGAATSSQATPTTPNSESATQTVAATTRPGETPAATQTSPAGTPAPTPLPEAPAGMAFVEGGAFKMGATAGKFEADETPPHLVTVDPFFIDHYEVTVAQYKRFANGSGYRTDAEKKGDAATWRVNDNPSQQNLPVTRISWNDADIFCRWYAKRLPTEAEWELAAKGFTENIYSWGSTFDATLANSRERGIGQPMPIGSSPGSLPFGAFDMIGNVWEWVLDRYAGDYYAQSPEANPAGPASGAERVIRGGSFKTDGERATTTNREKAFQDGYSDDIGFRCVRDAP